jgi:hypothetical protein
MRPSVSNFFNNGEEASWLHSQTFFTLAYLNAVFAFWGAFIW